MLTILLAAAIVCLASVSQAVTGFGFALVLVPLLSLVYPPKMVVLVSLTLGLACKPLLLAQCWRKVQLARIAPLTLAAVVGTFFGARLLLLASAPALQLGIGLVVVVLASAMLKANGRPLPRENLATALIGLLSGVLTGSTSMGGPPVVLLGVQQNWEKASFRANLLAFFTLSSISSLLSLWQAGAINVELLQLDAVLTMSSRAATAPGCANGNRARLRCLQGAPGRALSPAGCVAGDCHWPAQRLEWRQSTAGWSLRSRSASGLSEQGSTRSPTAPGCCDR